MKDQFQIHSLYEGTFMQAELLSCLVAKHDQSSGEGGCTVRTFVLFQRS